MSKLSCFILQALVYFANDVAASVFKKYQNRADPFISVGHSNFTKLVLNSEIFVDKTLFIKDFLESPSDVVMVTCPRRWGKSMNIDMLKTFLQVVVRKNGTRVDKKDALNTELFQRLEIAKHHKLMERYLGESHVIHLSFRSAGGLTYKDVTGGIRVVVGRACEEHLYLPEILWQLINGPNTNHTTKTIAQTHLDTFVRLHTQRASEKEVLQGLAFLSARLHELWGKKVFIFMDDFDKIMTGLFSSESIEINPQDVSYGMQYIQEFIAQALEKNEHFVKALITGVMRPETQKLFARLGNFQEHNMLHSDFYNHFGFTTEEVIELCKAFNLQSSQHTHVATYYGGYALTNTATLLHNSDSVPRYLREQISHSYWEEEGDLGPLEVLFHKENINDAVAVISKGTARDLDLTNLTLTTDDYIKLIGMFQREALVPDGGVELFLRMLFSQGYLTVDKKRSVNGTNKVSVKVPNKEVGIILKHKLAVEVWTIDYGAVLLGG
nr:PREDICTED: uncharacterized protein LOC109029778 [Bemisia tabaci]XP_018895950.1 PREDICTED: uncharacterized protein LOC109029778 [Bemisia tabaci]